MDIPPELSKNIDTADKIFSKGENLFEKYGWLIGLFVLIYGVYRVITSIISLVTVWQGFSVSGNITFILVPIMLVLVGVALIVIGAVLIKKLRKK